MKVKFIDEQVRDLSSFIVFIDDKKTLLTDVKANLPAFEKQIKHTIEQASCLDKCKQCFFIMFADGTNNTQIVIQNIGKLTELTALHVQTLGQHVQQILVKNKMLKFTFSAKECVVDSCVESEFAANFIYGIQKSDYRFDKYFGEEKLSEIVHLESLNCITTELQKTENAYMDMQAQLIGVDLCRDLQHEPANVLTPPAFAKKIKDLEQDGVKVEILGEDDMERLGMHSLLGVGLGSQHDSQLVIMHWQGNDKEQPIGLVGKGVCFDSGGISLKPGMGMDLMKLDMSGAAAVVGTMQALAKRKSKANVVGIVGLVENMPGSKAQRPGDIVKAMSGKTIEILNTDAEGRMVLADALWYMQDRFKPKLMVDLATLTGACIVALGPEYAGLYSNNDQLSKQLLSTGDNTGELLWRMPLPESYDKKLKSDIADIKHMYYNPGFGAGSITAALFLQHFVNDVAWAHIDMAGPGIPCEGSTSKPKFGSGYGVELLNQFIMHNFE